jgi:hypothetical protein
MIIFSEENRSDFISGSIYILPRKNLLRKKKSVFPLKFTLKEMDENGIS